MISALLRPLALALALSLSAGYALAGPEKPPPAHEDDAPQAENQNWTEGVAEADRLNAEAAARARAAALSDAEVLATFQQRRDAALAEAQAAQAAYEQSRAEHSAAMAERARAMADAQARYAEANERWAARVEACNHGQHDQCATAEERAAMRAAREQ